MAVTQGIALDLRRLVLGIPLHVNNAHLTGAGAAVTMTVPAGASFAVFSPYPKSADFLVRSGGTAIIPSADVTNGAASWPNPAIAAVTPLSTFQVVAGSASVDVAVAYYDNKSVSY